VGVFLHFAADLKGYWQKERAKARVVRWATAVLVVVTIVAGFFIVGTPWQARLYRFDDQKVSDLSMIQSQVASYWQAHQKLPASLADLNDSISGFTVPTDAQTGAQYEYTATGKTAFELCATFNAATQPYAVAAMTSPAMPYGPMGDSETWTHGPGRVCFERTIDPAQYPPAAKTAQ
jgi:hypothetical protein